MDTSNLLMSRMTPTPAPQQAPVPQQQQMQPQQQAPQQQLNSQGQQFQKALQYAQQNPTSAFATELRNRIQNGQMNDELKSIGKDPAQFVTKKPAPTQDKGDLIHRPGTGFANSPVAKVASALTSSEQGAGKDITAAFGPQQWTPELAQKNADQVSTLLALAKKLPEGDPHKAVLMRAAQDTANIGSKMASQNQANLPSNEKVLGDFGGVAVDALSGGTLEGAVKGVAENAATKTAGQLIMEGAKTGAKVGGVFGAAKGLTGGMSNDEGFNDLGKDTVKGGLIGAAAGGVLGGTIPAISRSGELIAQGKELASSAKDAVSEKLGGAIKPKPLAEIIATPESKLGTLSPADRQAWIDNRKVEITKQHETIAQKANQDLEAAKASHQKAQDAINAKHDQVNQKIMTDLQKSAEKSQAVAEELQKQSATAARDKAIESRPKALKAFAEQSKIYRGMVDEELAPYEKLKVNHDAIAQKIDSQFADNPQQAQAIKSRLGLSANHETTIGEMYTQAKSLRQDIATSARNGTRVFTPDEKLTDDSINVLTSYMKDHGVDLKNANQFWAKYAPVRNQLITELKPFNQSGTQTKMFANTLMRVSRGADVNNENFIKSVEDMFGKSVTKEQRDFLQKMSTNEKTAVAEKLQGESAKTGNESARASALKANDESLSTAKSRAQEVKNMSLSQKKESLRSLPNTAREADRAAAPQDVFWKAVKSVLGGGLSIEAARKIFTGHF